jgi:hypothetical protein
MGRLARTYNSKEEIKLDWRATVTVTIEEWVLQQRLSASFILDTRLTPQEMTAKTWSLLSHDQ